LPYLRQAGFALTAPEGAYYVMTDIAGFDSGLDDTQFVRAMIQAVGVSAVPGGSFHAPRELGKTQVRFMFAKRDETLHEAGQRLSGLREGLRTIANTTLAP
jgi:aspartate/methionine/tyrosine aminotransferase